MNDKSITRRKMLKTVSAGFGYLAFQGLAVQASAKETGGINTSKPLGAKKPHFSAKAKRVIFLCMRGGPSHMETFDPKPKLSADKTANFWDPVGNSRNMVKVAWKLLIFFPRQPSMLINSVSSGVCIPITKIIRKPWSRCIQEAFSS
jgi:hypothetical protein